MSFFLGTLILYKSTMEDSCKSCERIVKYIKTKNTVNGIPCWEIHMHIV